MRLTKVFFSTFIFVVNICHPVLEKHVRVKRRNYQQKATNF